MCWHKWREYRDRVAPFKKYRVCTKCGIAQKLVYDGWGGMCYHTNENLCKTNDWVDNYIYELRYGKQDENILCRM